jgi:hypothetical protein
MFAHAGKDEKAAHAHNVKAFGTSEWVDPKKATMHEGTFALLLRTKERACVGVCVFRFTFILNAGYNK